LLTGADLGTVDRAVAVIRANDLIEAAVLVDTVHLAVGAVWTLHRLLVADDRVLVAVDDTRGLVPATSTRAAAFAVIAQQGIVVPRGAGGSARVQSGGARAQLR